MAVSKAIDLSIMASFAVSCMLAIVFTLEMPETFGVKPPEMIEELKYEHHELDPSFKYKNY